MYSPELNSVSYAYCPHFCLLPPSHWLLLYNCCLHCKKELAVFPSPAGMSLTKLSLAGKIPAQEVSDQ